MKTRKLNPLLLYFAAFAATLAIVVRVFAAPPMVESGGNLFFPGITLTATPLGVSSGGSNLTASADDNVMVGNGTTWETKAVANCTDTAGNHLNYTASSNTFSCGTSSSLSSAGATFSGDVSITAYPLNTDWSAFIPFVAGTGRKICFTTEVVGTGTNGNTVLATFYDRTGAANVCTLAVGCNSTDAPVGTVTCADCGSSPPLAATRTYGMRWTTDNCTLRPSGELNVTYTTP